MHVGVHVQNGWESTRTATKEYRLDQRNLSSVLGPGARNVHLYEQNGLTRPDLDCSNDWTILIGKVMTIIAQGKISPDARDPKSGDRNRLISHVHATQWTSSSYDYAKKVQHGNKTKDISRLKGLGNTKQMIAKELGTVMHTQLYANGVLFKRQFAVVRLH